MTDPINPNQAPPYIPPPAPYTPPPPFAPPRPFAPRSDDGMYASPLYAPHPDPGAYVPPGGGGFPPYVYPAAAPPPPPSRARRNVLIAVAVVVVLVAAGLGAYLVFRGPGSSSRLALPTSFEGFSRENDAASSRVEGMMRGMGAGSGAEGKRFFDAATISLYQSDADVSSKLVVLAVRTSKVPHDMGGSANDLTAELLQFTGSAVAVQPGPHGGSARCGTTSMGAVKETACAWSDSATTGMLVSAGTPVTPDRLSAVELALRDQID